MKYSVVIPVFNSQGVVGATIDSAVAFFRKEALDFKVILVNDGSRDQSWEVIQQKAREYPKVIALDLLHSLPHFTGAFEACQMA